MFIVQILIYIKMNWYLGLYIRTLIYINIYKVLQSLWHTNSTLSMYIYIYINQFMNTSLSERVILILKTSINSKIIIFVRTHLQYIRIQYEIKYLNPYCIRTPWILKNMTRCHNLMHNHDTAPLIIRTNTMKTWHRIKEA